MLLTENAPGSRSGKDADAAYKSRLGYAKDYLYGFFPDTDERGYPDGSPRCSLSVLLARAVLRCLTMPRACGETREPDLVSMWIPGNGLNHNLVGSLICPLASSELSQGANLANGVARCRTPCIVRLRGGQSKGSTWSAIWLRALKAVPGTDLVYGATGSAVRCQVRRGVGG
eukprot:2107588-Rhodomonas_salina.6